MTLAAAMSTRARLTEFARGAPFVPEDDQDARGFAIGNVSRTHEFLGWALKDYRDAAQAFIAKRLPQFQIHEVRELTGAEAVAFDEGTRLISLVQMRIEVFYFLARRLLDELAQVLDAYVGPAATTIGSASNLAVRFPALVEERGLTDGNEVQRLGSETLDRIRGFRDRHVAHVRDLAKARKFRGLAFDLEVGLPRMAISTHGVPGTDESEDLDGLMALLDQYIDAVMDFLNANASLRPAD